jgi:hypothetical protein
VYHAIETSFSAFPFGFFPPVNMGVISDEHGEMPLGHFQNGKEVQWKMESKNVG